MSPSGATPNNNTVRTSNPVRWLFKKTTLKQLCLVCIYSRWWASELLTLRGRPLRNWDKQLCLTIREGGSKMRPLRRYRRFRQRRWEFFLPFKDKVNVAIAPTLITFCLNCLRVSFKGMLNEEYCPFFEHIDHRMKSCKYKNLNVQGSENNFLFFIIMNFWFSILLFLNTKDKYDVWNSLGWYF